MDQYLPVITLLVLAVVFGVISALASRLLAPRRPTLAKSAPYECGIVPRRDPPERFPVRFYLVAMIFIIFDIEMMATGGPHYDLARYGMEVFRASPRQADLMIVAGRVSQKMAPVLRQIYDQMMEPKWVISMGVCASSGGMFNNYAIVQGVDQVVPVDVYAPGCPPGPETLMHAILTLYSLIQTGELTQRRAATGGGAGLQVSQRDGQTAGDSPVTIGTR